MEAELRMKIIFIQDWDVPIEEQFSCEDGIREAVSILGKRHSVRFITHGKLASFKYRSYDYDFCSNPCNIINSFKPDIIICWGSLDRPWHGLLGMQYPNIPKILCFAGGPRQHEYLKYFKHVLVESKVYEDEFRAHGISVSRAFGTNTRVFRPRRFKKRRWDAIYPASLCFHKNIELFCRAMEDRGLVVGNHNEPTIASKVLSFGTNLLHRVDSTTLSDLYSLSHVTVVTAGPEGGAQRVVLESMSCGTPVVVMSDHDRVVEFVEESGFGRIVNPIDIEIREAVEDLIHNYPSEEVGTRYIMSKWTENHYADSMEKICQIL